MIKKTPKMDIHLFIITTDWKIPIIYRLIHCSNMIPMVRSMRILGFSPFIFCTEISRGSFLSWVYPLKDLSTVLFYSSDMLFDKYFKSVHTLLNACQRQPVIGGDSFTIDPIHKFSLSVNIYEDFENISFTSSDLVFT